MRVQPGPGLRVVGGGVKGFEKSVGGGGKRCTVEMEGLQVISLWFACLSPDLSWKNKLSLSMLPWILLSNSIFTAPPLLSFLSSPHLSLSADCIDSKWQGLSLSTKHWSHAELTLQVFWLTLSIQRGFDSHQPPWREATEAPEVSGIKRGEEVGTHFFNWWISWISM